MRKLLLSLLVAVGLWGATSWTGTPQWKVILETHKIGGTEPFKNALVFTPTEHTAYRISASCSATGNPASGWQFTFNWEDVVGTAGLAVISCDPGAYIPAQQQTFVLTPKVGVPVVVTGSRGQKGPLTYFGFYTVEELQ